MKKPFDCNAKAMHIHRVLTDNRCFLIWGAYALFSAGLCGWLLISTAGVGITLCILATYIVPLLCRFKAPHPRLSINPFSGGEDLLKPASAGGRMVTEAKAPATSQKGTA